MSARTLGAGWTGRGLAALFMLPGIYAAWAAAAHMRQDSDPGAWLLPLSAGLGCIVLSGGILLTGSNEPGIGAAPRLRGVAIGLLVAYAFVLLPFLGFLVGSLLLVIAIGLLFTTNRRRFILIGGVMLAIGMWALFAYALLQPLPTWWGS